MPHLPSTPGSHSSLAGNSSSVAACRKAGACFGLTRLMQIYPPPLVVVGLIL